MSSLNFFPFWKVVLTNKVLSWGNTIIINFSPNLSKSRKRSVMQLVKHNPMSTTSALNHPLSISPSDRIHLEYWHLRYRTELPCISWSSHVAAEERGLPLSFRARRTFVIFFGRVTLSAGHHVFFGKLENHRFLPRTCAPFLSDSFWHFKSFFTTVLIGYYDSDKIAQNWVLWMFPNSILLL